VQQVRNVALIVLGVLIVIVMVQNAQPITFRFLNWRYQVSQLLLVVIVLALGFLAGFITAKVWGRSKDDVASGGPQARA
jgi:uncharacterized integral membrane protein